MPTRPARQLTSAEQLTHRLSGPEHGSNDLVAPEIKQAPEQAPDRLVTGNNPLESGMRNTPVRPVAPTTQPPTTQPRSTELQRAVEHILEEGLTDTYQQLAPRQQRRFKIQGEKTANKIATLLRKTGVTISQLVALISKWLKLLPGVSRFFIEQETKRKAEKIIVLQR